MKKIITTFCLSTLSLVSIAQLGPYVSFNTGVAIPSSTEAIGTSTVTTSGGDEVVTNIYGSYGRGLNLKLNAGYKVTQNFGAELGVGYLFGFNTTVGEESGPNSNTTRTARSFQLRIMPALVFETTNEALTLYSKAGLVIPISGRTTGELISSNTFGSITTETIVRGESRGAFSIGYFGAVGASLKIAKNLKAFAEVELINLKIKQKSQTITEFTLNGDDILDSRPTQEIETEFVDQVDPVNDNLDPDQPAIELATKRNFNSIGFNLGIRLNF